MRLMLIVVLLFVAADTAAQTNLGQFPEKPEPITAMPYGGYAHENVLKTKERTDGVSPSLTPARPSWIPRPILFAGPSFVGNGYQTIAESLGGGLMLNSKWLISNAEGRYMNARKTNDNTVNNRKGHERYLQERVFYKMRPNLYFGGGAQWSETSTTNYTKQAWRPTFGGGGDHFASDWSCRWQVLYIMPGTDRQNALQGPEVQFWLPSPASKSHFFYRQTLGMYEFHTTITDPADKHLTALQTADRQHAAFLDFTFGWRF